MNNEDDIYIENGIVWCNGMPVASNMPETIKVIFDIFGKKIKEVKPKEEAKEEEIKPFTTTRKITLT